MKGKPRTPLVVQWLGICLAMWGMQFWSQAQKLGSHTQSDWARGPQLERPHATALEAHALEPARCKY